MDRQTSAILVELEAQLQEEGVPEEKATDFIDRIEKEIEDLLETLEDDDEEESKIENG